MTSGGSASSSDYSSDSSSKQSGKDTQPESSSAVRRRSSIPSEGAAQRRRQAIVQMDSLYEHDSISKPSSDSDHSNNNLRSRRGLEKRLGDLALLTSSDAAPERFTYLPPPSTAPITSEGANQRAFIGDSTHDKKRHNRSASESVGPTKMSPRDVGIVGTSPTTEQHKQESYADNRALRPPIFQMPKSRSPSPGGISDQSECENTRLPVKSNFAVHTSITPKIGQGEKTPTTAVPLAVTALDSDNSPEVETPRFRQTNSATQIVEPVPSPLFTPTKPLSYLHYQPGGHRGSACMLTFLICSRYPCNCRPTTSSATSYIQRGYKFTSTSKTSTITVPASVTFERGYEGR
jgi:hypothetical protein